MKDFMGKEIKIDRRILYMENNKFKVGIVKRITRCRVYIQTLGGFYWKFSKKFTKAPVIFREPQNVAMSNDILPNQVRVRMERRKLKAV